MPSEPTAPPLPASTVLARRRARFVFGAILASGGVILPALALLTSALGTEASREVGIGFFATLGLAALGYLVLRLAPLATARLQRVSTVATAASPGATFDGDAAAAGWLERHALIWPAVGLGFMAPLSSHAVVFFGLGSSLVDFGDWITVSMMFVGLAHLAFAMALGLEANALARAPDAFRMGPAIARVVGLSTVAGCVPGIIFLGVPPLMVAFTAGVLTPLILAWLQASLARERASLAAT